MKRSGHLAAVFLVTATLCVEGVTAPVAAAAPQVAQLACRLANRLSVSFRQSVPSSPMQWAQRPGAVPPPARTFVAREPACPVHRCAFRHYQFRLPPPTIA
jgi:hypothetical protein